MSGLQDRLSACKDRYKYLSAVRDTRERALEEMRSDAVRLREEAAEYGRAHTVLSMLMEKRSKKNTGEMDKLVNFGLRTVFSDRDITMKTELSDTGKRVLFKMSTYSGDNKALMDDHGSVSVIQSLLLRVLCIIKLKLPRVLFLDETLAAIDATYINDAATLLTELAQRLNFDICIATHNPGNVKARVYRGNLHHKRGLEFVKEGLVAPTIQH